MQPPSNSRRPSRLIDALKWFVFACGMLLSMATNLADDEKKKSSAEETLNTCANDEDCAPHDETPYCLDSYSVCVECHQDDQCDSQRRCYENRCVDRCESSDACAEGLVCVEGVCKGCEIDGDCAEPSLYCYIGPEFTACRPLCGQSLECTGPGYAEGDVCRGGRCQSIACGSDLDCSSNQEFCDVSTQQCEAVQ